MCDPVSLTHSISSLCAPCGLHGRFELGLFSSRRPVFPSRDLSSTPSSSPSLLMTLTTCLCFARFDYCKFVELDYVPMQAGCMVSMRPTKGFGSSKSSSKGLSSTRSPDRHGHSESSSSTPRSRLVPRTMSQAVPCCEIFSPWLPR